MRQAGTARQPVHRHGGLSSTCL